MEKSTQSIASHESNLKRIIIGTGISIVCTLVGLVVFSCLITYTNIGESTIPSVTVIITIISILIGTTISMLNLRKNGIINGALVGILYIFLIYFLSSIIEKDFSLNTYSIIMLISSIFIGALGGIIGVNMGAKKM